MPSRSKKRFSSIQCSKKNDDKSKELTDVKTALRVHCSKREIVDTLCGAHFMLHPSTSNKGDTAQPIAVRVYFPDYMDTYPTPEEANLVQESQTPDMDGLVAFQSSFALTIVFFVIPDAEKYMTDDCSFVRRAMRMLARSSQGSGIHQTRTFVYTSIDDVVDTLLQIADANTPEKQQLKKAYFQRHRQAKFAVSDSNSKNKRGRDDSSKIDFNVVASHVSKAIHALCQTWNCPAVEANILQGFFDSLEALASATPDSLSRVPVEVRTKNLILSFFQEIDENGQVAFTDCNTAQEGEDDWMARDDVQKALEAIELNHHLQTHQPSPPVDNLPDHCDYNNNRNDFDRSVVPDEIAANMNDTSNTRDQFNGFENDFAQQGKHQSSPPPFQQLSPPPLSFGQQIGNSMTQRGSYPQSNQSQSLVEPSMSNMSHRLGDQNIFGTNNYNNAAQHGLARNTVLSSAYSSFHDQDRSIPGQISAHMPGQMSSRVPELVNISHHMGVQMQGQSSTPYHMGSNMSNHINMPPQYAHGRDFMHDQPPYHALPTPQPLSQYQYPSQNDGTQHPMTGSQQQHFHSQPFSNHLPYNNNNTSQHNQFLGDNTHTNQMQATGQLQNNYPQGSNYMHHTTPFGHHNAMNGQSVPQDVHANYVTPSLPSRAFPNSMPSNSFMHQTPATNQSEPNRNMLFQYPSTPAKSNYTRPSFQQFSYTGAGAPIRNLSKEVRRYNIPTANRFNTTRKTPLRRTTSPQERKRNASRSRKFLAKYL